MLHFLFQSARGYWFHPWDSPYLRWRVETYWGLHADEITPAQFRAFLWDHRAELMRFLRWTRRMRHAANA